MEKLEKTIEEVIAEIPGREMTEEECENFIEIDETDSEWWEFRGLKKPEFTEDDLKKQQEDLLKSQEEETREGFTLIDGEWIENEF